VTARMVLEWALRSRINIEGATCRLLLVSA
jgi:hypothetical protein